MATPLGTPRPRCPACKGFVVTPGAACPRCAAVAQRRGAEQRMFGAATADIEARYPAVTRPER